VAVGIGDDCAVLRVGRGRDLLVTTDLSIERVHFRREWHPPDSVGHRCLTRGLSDMAAMGGEPVAAFVSLALPRQLPQRWVDEFFEGLLRLARKYKVQLAGGDIAQAEQIAADIVVVGSVPAGKAVLRSGARPGDAIFVTGRLGASAAVLKMLQEDRKIRARRFPEHFYPVAQIEVARRLRQSGRATAMIDISDGLSVDLAHICGESGVGARVEQAAIPRAKVDRVQVSLEMALHGGEDYQLLFTSRKRIPKTVAGVEVTRIGIVTSEPGVVLVDERGRENKLESRGWEHFANE
jgi:thiamine-monophosphate kinase